MTEGVYAPVIANGVCAARAGAFLQVKLVPAVRAGEGQALDPCYLRDGKPRSGVRIGSLDRLRRRVAAAHGMRTRRHAAGRDAYRDENHLLPWPRSRPSRCAPALVGDAVPPAIGLGSFTRREVELQMGEGVASSRPAGERIDKRARPRAEAEPPSTLTGAATGPTGERIGFDDGECVRRQRACVASPRRIKRRRRLSRDVIVGKLRKARSRHGRRRNERWKRISSCCHLRLRSGQPPTAAARRFISLR
jgi:hypothetical protein